MDGISRRRLAVLEEMTAIYRREGWGVWGRLDSVLLSGTMV